VGCLAAVVVGVEEAEGERAMVAVVAVVKGQGAGQPSGEAAEQPGKSLERAWREPGESLEARWGALGARFDRPVSGTDQHAGKERGRKTASAATPAANHSGAAFVAPPPNCRRRSWPVCQLSLPAAKRGRRRHGIASLSGLP
jgi:hypothetical protein